MTKDQNNMMMMMYGLKSQRSSSTLQQTRRISVLFSLLGLLIFCGTYVSAQRVAAPRTDRISAPTSPSIVPSAGKQPARRVMPAAFANAGQNAGLQIWRIENFQPVLYPERDHGKFYSGDSYIILNTKADRNGRKTWDIHFWLGSETSQDEAGAAAILSVQLDDLLNGDPVQHREVQDHESNLFLGYFKNGIRYEKGGVGSGFKHVEPNAPGEKRLFQVKGKRNVRVRQVNLSVASMNKGDCFILDAGNTIYVYVGTGAKRVEKLKAISAANQIRDQDHNGRATVNIIDEYSTDIDKQEFFTILGSGSPNEVPEESVDGDDETFEANEERITTLYKVTDVSGQLKIDPVSTKPLRQEFLDTNDCFILDTGSGIFVWVGKRATQQEKSQAMARAQEFLTTKKYPAWTQVRRIVEGAESAPFKQYFSTWQDHGMAHTRLIRAINEVLDESAIEILKRSGGRALGFMPDNGSGELVGVWVYKNGAVEEVLADKYGIFVSSGVYVVKYSFETENGEKGLVSYFWLGKKSSETDQISAEENASQSNDETPTSIIVRITQNHEPRHFRKSFKGKLFTTFEKDVGQTSLYRIRGTSADDLVTEELELKPSSLSSDDVFLIGSSEKYYIWNGQGASEFEKAQAVVVVKDLTENVEVVEEGSEPEDFWNLLGGKGEYDKTIGHPGAPLLEPRLFHCKILANGRFRFEEIGHFRQEDLDVDDVMLLDGGDEVYAWIGCRTTATEQKKAFELAKEYIRNDPTERSEDTVALIKLREGHEPGCFKRIFPSWDDEYWKSVPTYEDVKLQFLEIFQTTMKE